MKENIFNLTEFKSEHAKRILNAKWKAFAKLINSGHKSSSETPLKPIMIKKMKQPSGNRAYWRELGTKPPSMCGRQALSKCGKH